MKNLVPSLLFVLVVLMLISGFTMMNKTHHITQYKCNESQLHEVVCNGNTYIIAIPDEINDIEQYSRQYCEAIAVIRQ